MSNTGMNSIRFQVDSEWYKQCLQFSFIFTRTRWKAKQFTDSNEINMRFGQLSRRKGKGITSVTILSVKLEYIAASYTQSLCLLWFYESILNDTTYHYPEPTTPVLWCILLPQPPQEQNMGIIQAVCKTNSTLVKRSLLSILSSN